MEDKLTTTKPEIIIEPSPQIPSKWLLLALIVLSSGLDLILSGVELPFVIPTFGGIIIVEEVLEYFISIILARYGMHMELKTSDKLIGWLPIPGVTSLSIRALRLLFKSSK